jgi:hypothetical protein
VQPASRPWYAAIIDWIAGVGQDLLRTLDRALGKYTPLETAIGDVIVVAAFGAFGYAVFLLARSFVRGPASRRGSAAWPNARDGSRARAAELHAAALAAGRAERYREAAALLFVAAERELDEAGRLAYDAARTPGELRILVHDPDFDALARDAVVALFASAEPQADLFARMRANYERFFGTAAA